MADLLDGRALAARIQDKVTKQTATLPSKPGMAAILVGDDPASHLYVRLKEKACLEAGMHFEKHLFNASISTNELLRVLKGLNERTDIHGILVQLPLPNQDTDAIIAAIDPRKDVDGFHSENLRRLQSGEPGLISPVALGVMKFLDEATVHRPLPEHAVLVCSEIFGKPLLSLLHDRGISTTVVSPRDPELNAFTKKADLLIVAAGIPGLIHGDMIKQGAIVIDVGTTKTETGLLGDVDAASAVAHSAKYTPVPGGVGPVTVAMLCLNVLKAYRLIEAKSGLSPTVRFEAM